MRALLAWLFEAPLHRRIYRWIVDDPLRQRLYVRLRLAELQVWSRKNRKAGFKVDDHYELRRLAPDHY